MNARVVAVAFGTVILGVVGTMGFYMPYKSPGALANRERIKGTAKKTEDTAAKHDRVAGSVWANLDRHKRR